MVCEVEFLTRAELFDVKPEMVHQVSLPMGEPYPPEIFSNYFAWYGGMVKKFRPTRFLEIGVRYGYTGIVVCNAAAASDPSYLLEYRGIDDESYPPARGARMGSCAQANEHFKTAVPLNDALAIKWNSITQGLPPGIGAFDMIHIDGNHDYPWPGHDIRISWPVLNEGGFLLFDDVQMDGVRRGIEEWLEEMHVKEEVIAVQFVENERGHCYIAKTGLRSDDERGLEAYLQALGYAKNA